MLVDRKGDQGVEGNWEGILEESIWGGTMLICLRCGLSECAASENRRILYSLQDGQALPLAPPQN